MKKATRQTTLNIAWTVTFLLFLGYLLCFDSLSSVLKFVLGAAVLAIAVYLIPRSRIQEEPAVPTPSEPLPETPEVVETSAESLLPADEEPIAVEAPVEIPVSEDTPAEEPVEEEIPAETSDAEESLTGEAVAEEVSEDVPAAEAAPVEAPAADEIPGEDLSEAAPAAEEAEPETPSRSDIPCVPIVPAAKRAPRAKVSEMPYIKLSNITRSTVLDRLFPLVVLNVKTTGTKIVGNDILEITAVKYEAGFSPVACFTTRCKSRKPIPAEAVEAHHITDADVQDRPHFQYIAPGFSEFIAGCNILGHDLPFDLRFLFVFGVTLPKKARYYDILDLSKVLFKPKSRKADQQEPVEPTLELLCSHYGIQLDETPLSDCCATAAVFQRIIADKRC